MIYLWRALVLVSWPMSDSDPFSALFHVLGAMPGLSGRALFINAQTGAGLAQIGRNSLMLQTSCSKAAALTAEGWQVVQHVPDREEFDLVLMLVGKQQEENRALLAQGLLGLRAGGLLVAAGANDAGGKRLEKDFAALGLTARADSKNKCRVVQARKAPGVNEMLAQQWIAQGSWQPVLEGRFISRPGLFSWDRADPGSLLLSEHVPFDLGGRGADFGCGYGFLSAHLLRACPAVAHITALDADARAVEASRKNTAFAPARVTCAWHDLTRAPDLHDLDFIVMNPPFHEGVRTLSALGAAFITNAAACLKRGGVLYMVANTHLPYEDHLRALFSDVRQLHKEKGFKVIRAVK